MTQAEPLTPHQVIAGRIRELRTQHGWSAQKLADEMSAVGISWDRSVVANFENGRRQSISIEELLALAYVLSVAPVHLLVPPVDDDNDEPRMRAVPTMTVPPGAARQWIRGEMPFGTVDPRRYFSQVPPEEFGRGPYGGGSPGAIVQEGGTDAG